MAKNTNKYMLISVCDREILTEQFPTHKDAVVQMQKEIAEAIPGGPEGEIIEAMVSGKDFEIEGLIAFGQWSGYLNDGANHGDYDWLIVAL